MSRKPYAAITVPPGASFKDMVALKGRRDIGDQINKKVEIVALEAKIAKARQIKQGMPPSPSTRTSPTSSSAAG